MRSVQSASLHKNFTPFASTCNPGCDQFNWAMRPPLRRLPSTPSVSNWPIGSACPFSQLCAHPADWAKEPGVAAHSQTATVPAASSATVLPKTQTLAQARRRRARHGQATVGGVGAVIAAARVDGPVLMRVRS